MLRRREEKEKKKTIVSGITNAGKTAMINAIIWKDLERTKDLLITKGIERRIIETSNFLFHIWELGGIHVYRKRYLKKPEMYFYSMDEIIHVIDAQDASSFNESINYISKIISVLNEVEINEKEFKFFFFFHKIDPNLSFSSKISENIVVLTKKIKSLNIPFSHEIYLSSIFNFKRNQANSIFYNEDFSDIGNLACKLFAHQKILLKMK